MFFVTVNDALFVQSGRKYTRVITKDREAFISQSIKSLIEALAPNQFTQIHRGTLITVNFLDVVERHSLRSMQVRLRGSDSALKSAPPYWVAFRECSAQGASIERIRRAVPLDMPPICGGKFSPIFRPCSLSNAAATRKETT